MTSAVVFKALNTSKLAEFGSRNACQLLPKFQVVYAYKYQILFLFQQLTTTLWRSDLHHAPFISLFFNLVAIEYTFHKSKFIYTRLTWSDKGNHMGGVLSPDFY